MKGRYCVNVLILMFLCLPDNGTEFGRDSGSVPGLAVRASYRRNHQGEDCRPFLLLLRCCHSNAEKEGPVMYSPVPAVYSVVVRVHHRARLLVGTG